MRGLVVSCLLVGALTGAGCGSSGNSSSTAPSSQQAAAKQGKPQSVAVAAQAVAGAASLCAPEGVAKPKKQCSKALKKLQKGNAKNPNAACKGLSKKKTKGVRGKSPFAVCVTAAAKLMAAKNHPSSGNGSADSSSSDTSTTGDNADTSTDSTDATDSQPLCVDANGNAVAPDDPNVEDCTDSADSSGDTSTDATSTDDTSTDGSGN